MKNDDIKNAKKIKYLVNLTSNSRKIVKIIKKIARYYNTNKFFVHKNRTSL